MKRLLTYLFLVLGLTILFQSKSYAPIRIYLDDEGNLIADKQPTQTQQVAKEQDKIALIIGIEKYKALPKATFASKDANE